MPFAVLLGRPVQDDAAVHDHHRLVGDLEASCTCCSTMITEAPCSSATWRMTGIRASTARI
jgi:hypothetical protein